jgi:phage-related protein
MWTAWQYRQVWSDLYDKCDEVTQLKLDVHLNLLREKGNLSRRPISAHLHDRIFELRAKSARMLFYFEKERNIIFVHCFFKDTRAVSRQDIKTAQDRRAEIQGMGIKLNALPN